MSNDIIPETKRIKRSPIEVAFEVLAEADLNKEQEEAYIIIRELLQPSPPVSDGELTEQIRLVRTGDQTHHHKWILAVEAVCKAAQQPQREEWLDISSAPRDMTQVILYAYAENTMTENNDVTRALEEVNKTLARYTGKSYLDGAVISSSLTKNMLETIRTALLKSAQVDGLVKTLGDILVDVRGKDFSKNDAIEIIEKFINQFSATEI